MMNKIFIAILVIVVIGSIAVVSTQDKEVSNTETQINNTEEVEDLSVGTPLEEEYVIDAGDMYSVDAIEQNFTPPTVTEIEEKWLILLREEEKLARDVYLTLADMWEMRIFSNIASSEQTHTDAIKTLLERYGLEDPVTDDTIGVFADPEMQKLYDDLTEQGAESLLSALIVGATVEDLDINDLDKAMAETEKEEINVVYQNLQKGSRNHMRAFVQQIERQSGTYTPQYIPVSDYENIISSQQERYRIE